MVVCFEATAMADKEFSDFTPSITKDGFLVGYDPSRPVNDQKIRAGIPPLLATVFASSTEAAGRTVIFHSV